MHIVLSLLLKMLPKAPNGFTNTPSLASHAGSQRQSHSPSKACGGSRVAVTASWSHFWCKFASCIDMYIKLELCCSSIVWPMLVCLFVVKNMWDFTLVLFPNYTADYNHTFTETCEVFLDCFILQPWQPSKRNLLLSKYKCFTFKWRETLRLLCH